MSSYHVEINPAARRDLKKFKRSNLPLTHIFISLIDGLAADPYGGKPLTGDKQGCYSLRHSDYRIIYAVYEQSRTVLVVRVGHRREVYR